MLHNVRKCCLILMTNILPIFIIISFKSLDAAEIENSSDQAPSILQTRPEIIILDFFNAQKSADFAYLEDSIPDTFLEPVDKTETFKLLSRSEWKKLVDSGKFKPGDAARDDRAAEAGRQIGADVVITGSFAAMKDNIRIFIKAIQLPEGNVIITRSIKSPLDNNMLDVIADLAEEISDDLKGKASQIVSHSVKYSEPTTTENTSAGQNAKSIIPKSVNSFSPGSLAWRTALLPGWGHIYAGQQRGWIYSGLWAGSAGLMVYSILRFSETEKIYQSATTNIENAYSDYNDAWKLRTYSSLGVLTVYAVSIIDSLMTGSSLTSFAGYDLTLGGMLWRNIVIPGWGQLYAGQSRGWIYSGLWVISGGTLAYALINFDQAEKAYQSATSGFDQKYAVYNEAWKLRNYSLMAIAGVYAVSTIDAFITGLTSTLKPRAMLKVVAVPDYDDLLRLQISYEKSF